MKINRIWAMPNKWTFQVKPIGELINRYVGDGGGWIDPFAATSSMAEYTNDLNPDHATTHTMDAIDFVSLDWNNLNGVLFDPPYSPRQVSECYKMAGKKVTSIHTSARFWSEIKNELADKIALGGYAISCCWNSNGFGKKRGFEIVEILIVAHGGHHNDTIVTVEKKIQSKLC